MCLISEHSRTLKMVYYKLKYHLLLYVSVKNNINTGTQELRVSNIHEFQMEDNSAFMNLHLLQWGDLFVSCEFS